MRKSVVRFGSLIALAMVVGTCSDSRNPGVLVPEVGDGAGEPAIPVMQPARQMLDGWRGGGNPHFHWLYPIVEVTGYSGTFDATLAPRLRIEVCRLAGDVCTGAPVAVFTSAGATYWSRIQVSAPRQYYLAYWSTAGTIAGEIYRATVLLDGSVVLGHADVKALASRGELGTVDRDEHVGIAVGDWLALRFRLETGVDAFNTAPTVSISGPVDGSVFGPGDPITLSGAATDDEDGDISSAIRWSSDRDGVLGTGASVTPALSGGAHVITASVTDAAGTTATARRSLLVGIVGLQQTVVVPFGAQASLPITLAQPAPPGGLTVTVTSDEPGVVAVLTPTVTIPAGALAANAALEGVAPGSATITATTPNLGSDQAQATVSGALRFEPDDVAFTAGLGGGTTTVAIFSGSQPAIAPPGGLVVTLAAGDPACVTVPTTAAITAGEGGVTVPISYGGSAALPCTTTIDASAPHAAAAQATVQINAAPVIQLPPQLFVEGVGAGMMRVATGQLSSDDHGGVIVALTSPDPNRLLLAVGSYSGVPSPSIQIPVSDGSTSFTFTVHALEGPPGTSQIVASAPGFLDGGTTVDIVQPYFALSGVPASREVFGGYSRPGVSIGVANQAGTALRSQVLRLGSPLQVTYTSDAVTVASYQSATGAWGAAGTTLAARPSGSGFPTFPDAELRAEGVGTVNIGASIPGFLPFPSGASSREMEVTGSGIDFNTSQGPVGVGLMNAYAASLSQRPTVDTDVTVTSLDPGKALVSIGTSSASGGAVASTSATTTVRASSSSLTFTFHVHALEGASGTVDLTLSAPGFAPTTVTITLVDPVFRFDGFNGSPPSRTINTLALADFTVRMAVRPTSGSWDYQAVRSDGVAQPVVFTSDDPALGGFLDATSQRVTTLTTAIQPGQGDVVARFDPVAGGETGISVVVPGIAAGNGNAGVLYAQAPGITLSGAPDLGEGLMVFFGPYLQQAAPAGGVSVTVTSSDPSVLQVGPQDYANPGASVVVPVTAGNGQIRLALHGISTGAATLTFQAEEYATSTTIVNVAPGGLQISGLSPTIQTFDADDGFDVRTGYTPATGGSFSIQRVRTGAGPLAVTVSNSDPSVAELVSGASRGQSVQVLIPEGAFSASAAFSPLVNGSTEVTLSAPGFIQRPGIQHVVTVVSPQIRFSSVPSAVGAGLYTINRTVDLRSAQHGGVTVTIESSNPAKLLVGDPDGSNAGASVSVFVPDGVRSAAFSIHGVPGQVATNVQIKASAQGFLDGTHSVDVIVPNLRVNALNASAKVGATADVFEVLLEATSYEFQSVQDPAGLPITLTVSDGALAQLGDGVGTGQTVTVVIPQGAYRTGSILTLAPLAPGVVQLTTTAPGANTDTRFITINP